MPRRLLLSRSKAGSLEASWADWEDATVTLEDLGNVGEFVGALAVVASLIYVALQLRQHTEQMAENAEEARHASMERLLENVSRWRELIIRDPEISEIFTRGSQDMRQLSEAEVLRFYLLIEQIFHTLEVYYLRCHRTTPDEWIVSRKGLRRLLENPGVRQYYEANRGDFDPIFVEEVERVMAELSGPAAGS
jgi:hypothetical protein